MDILTYQSPIGWIKLSANQERLLSCFFTEDDTTLQHQNPILQQAKQELNEYFDGTRQVFKTPLGFDGTEFQQEVWEHVCQIPHGETSSYHDIAQKVGSHKKTRAVGLANGKNKLAIFVPCHRVIGSDGKLTGYAGGLERKLWLLQHEKAELGIVKQQKLL